MRSWKARLVVAAGALILPLGAAHAASNPTPSGVSCFSTGGPVGTGRGPVTRNSGGAAGSGIYVLTGGAHTGPGPVLLNGAAGPATGCASISR